MPKPLSLDRDGVSSNGMTLVFGSGRPQRAMLAGALTTQVGNDED